MARAHGAWVRLHYVYPYPHVDEVIERMTTDPAQAASSPTSTCRSSMRARAS